MIIIQSYICSYIGCHHYSDQNLEYSQYPICHSLVNIFKVITVLTSIVN